MRPPVPRGGGPARTLPLLALLVLWGTGMASGQDGPERIGGEGAAATTEQSPAPVRFELPNGLRVWVQEDRRRPVVFVQIHYHVGWLNEEPGTAGIAHYVEHMAYRATENLPNEEGYRFIDRIGGRWSGATGPMRTMYREVVPSWALEDALHLTAERMHRAVFDETEVERERGNVVTEANGFSGTTPEEAFRDALMATSFELHPYRYSANSWARDNLSVTRAELYGFYRRFYGPNNAVLAVVGDVSAAEVRRLVEKHFGPILPAPSTGEVTLVEPPQRAEKLVTVRHPDVEPRVEILFRAPRARHPAHPTLAVLDRILAPRLERALAAVGGRDITTHHDATPYPHVFRITAAVSGDHDRVVEVIQSEIERLGQEGVPADELRAARAAAARGTERSRRGAERCPSTGDPPRHQQIVDALLAREVFPWEVGPAVRETIRSAAIEVTPADIQAYVDRWLRRSQRTVGHLVAAEDDFMPEWTDGRPIVGDRIEIPSLTVPPEPRRRPSPAPPQALEPLGELSLEMERRTLENGAIVWAASRPGAAAALQARIRVDAAAEPAGKAALAVLAARAIAAAPGLREAGFEADTGDPTSIENHGYFDLRLCFPAERANAALDALALALGTAGVDGGRVDAARALLAETRPAAQQPPAMTARARVLEAVAPTWRSSPPATAESLAAITATDVNRFLSEYLHAGTLTVGFVGPAPTGELLDAANRAFGRLRTGRRAATAPAPPTARGGSGAMSGLGFADCAPYEEDRILIPAEVQVDIVAGLPAVPRNHPDWLPLQLLDYIVGAPFYGGRLGWALTVGGLTYSSSAVTTAGLEAGHILFTTRANPRNAPATVQAIREVVAQVGREGIADWEVREAQAFVLGRLLLFGPRADSDPATLAGALVDREFPGEQVLDPPALSRAVLSVTPEQVNLVARRYYRADRLKLVAIGALPPQSLESPFPLGTFQALFRER